uniref:GIT domain-containing protein n=1 Tax=Elaeophora elaphi TaxID=1147741 RepID=A0A0R3S1E1_9BILA
MYTGCSQAIAFRNSLSTVSQEKVKCVRSGQCNNETHPWMPASEIIFGLKGRIAYTNAEMAKSVENVEITGKDAMRSLHGLIKILTELKKQCEGVSEVVKVLSDALIDRQNNADIRRTGTDEHLPFTSILIQKLRAEIEDNKSLAQEASAVAVLFGNLIKQSNDICKDARNLMNSFSLEKKLEVERKDNVNIELEDDVISQKSNLNAFGDNMLDDNEYDVTVREAKREDERMEDSGKTGVLNETATMPSAADTAVKKTTSTDQM